MSAVLTGTMPYGKMQEKAVPFLLKLGPKDNGKAMEVPE
jgi:hypothetical protein